jgi:hypothetical protein
MIPERVSFAMPRTSTNDEFPMQITEKTPASGTGLMQAGL